MPEIRDRWGRVRRVPESNEDYQAALRGEGVWAVVSVAQPSTSDAGAGSPEPAPVAGPVKRKRGRPRKDANRRSR